MALEKRYNFTLDDLSVVANGYSHFQKYLKNEQGSNSIICYPPFYSCRTKMRLGFIQQGIMQDVKVITMILIHALSGHASISHKFHNM